MNKLILIGNLTSDPELRGTPSGNTVCSFGLAVNDRKGGNEATMFFRVSAWGKMGEMCNTYLAKGKKVFVAGPMSCRTYSKSDGSTGVSLEITANDVEFLSPREEKAPGGYFPAPTVPQGGMTPVETDELPF